ncbi:MULTISPECIES: hypothetical protein [Clostridium]|jgi:hypothetical protein|uniref:hypothetical protein n=1 Tax=Clostridium TaxID=1485 RepID=UPI000E545FED|nr:hypothetical protein [Clostridium fessum]RHP54801.1 hypothetical protein DWZ16_14755 [Clostridium sp. AF29-8BH]
MERMIKLLGMVAIIGVMLFAGFDLGRYSAGHSAYVDTGSEEFQNNFVDMRKVTNYNATDTGLYIYLEDGSGYYWER